MLYTIMGVFVIIICVLLFKIANRPRYTTSEDTTSTIKEVTFQDVSNDTPTAESIEEETINDGASENDASSETALEEEKATTQMGKTSTKVNIRELADSESRILETVEADYTFEILEILDSGWVKIVYGDGIGYISSSYVILTN